MPRPWPDPPSEGTLRSYGLTAADWREMCKRQGGRCPVCGEPFGDRPLVVDHEHVRGFRARKTRSRNGRTWKVRVMSPEERRRHVRGVLHSFCNRFVRRWLTRELIERVGPYLAAHDARKAAL